MKDYREVVETRYNKETDHDRNQSIYSKSHPIGKYSRSSIFRGLKDFGNWYSEKIGNPKSATHLDIGCGSGEMLSFFAGNGFSANNMMGIDFSEVRIQRAIKEYPEIDFATGDLLSLNLHEKRFDLITAFDILSHFKTEEEILQALANIYKHLNKGGIFLWYDIYSKDHFNAPANAESSGFNKAQMEYFAGLAGFEITYTRNFFKLFFNRYHSIYQAARVPFHVLRTLELLLPGSPGNIMMVMQKKTIHIKL